MLRPLAAALALTLIATSAHAQEERPRSLRPAGAYPSDGRVVFWSAARRRRERDRWRKHGEDLAPHLVRRIEEPGGARRREAMRLLALLGPAAIEGAPALRKALDDPDEATVRAAARALRAVEPAPRPAPPR